MPGGRRAQTVRGTYIVVHHALPLSSRETLRRCVAENSPASGRCDKLSLPLCFTFLNRLRLISSLSQYYNLLAYRIVEYKCVDLPLLESGRWRYREEQSFQSAL